MTTIPTTRNLEREAIKTSKKGRRNLSPKKGVSQPNKERIKPFDLKESLAGVLNTIDKRKSTGSLEDREV